MYTVRLCAYEFMGIWRVEAEVFDASIPGHEEILARTSQDFALSADFEDDDELTNTFRVIREWAEGTISA